VTPPLNLFECLLAAYRYGDRHQDAVYRADRRRIAFGIYCLLNGASRTVFLPQVSHNSVRRCLVNTKRNKYWRSAPHTNTLEDCLRSTVEINTLISLRKAKAMLVVATGVSPSSQLVRIFLETLGSIRQGKSHCSRTALFHRNRNESVPGMPRWL